MHHICYVYRQVPRDDGHLCHIYYLNCLALSLFAFRDPHNWRARTEQHKPVRVCVVKRRTIKLTFLSCPKPVSSLLIVPGFDTTVTLRGLGQLRILFFIFLLFCFCFSAIFLHRYTCAYSQLCASHHSLYLSVSLGMGTTSGIRCLKSTC